MKTAQPRKQHKMLYQAPLHVRYRHFSAPLSDSLRTTYHVGSVPVRTGDSVRVMRGGQKGSEGKVTKVDRKKYRVLVEGITQQRVDGTAIQIPIHPSKVMITNLNLDDKWRQKSLKIEAAKEPKKVEEMKKPEKAKKERKKRKPRKQQAEKPKAVRKKKSETSATREKGETETG